MKKTGNLLAFVVPLLFIAPLSAEEIDFGTLIDEMHDLSLLARMPDPYFTTVQFSSYDRRSTSPEAPSWYSNADGFGRESVPGFLKVLREPVGDGTGLYLMAEVDGPGAIVRGWTAAIGGILRVYLDGAETALFDGQAHDFLARKSEIFFTGAGADMDFQDAFRQQDADYMPIPFGKSLRVTWEGKIPEVHFYHLEVRKYAEGTKVRTFDPEKDPAEHMDRVKAMVERMTRPSCAYEGEDFKAKSPLEPGRRMDWSFPTDEGPGAVTEFTLAVRAADLDQALRGTLLRIAFDGAHKVQVDAPAGDFFGSGPGVNPFDSLPLTVREDGTMVCRYVMPFQRKAAVTFFNSTDEQIMVEASAKVSPWLWDDRSLYFRAKWRNHRDLDLTFGPFDVPFIVARGAGRFVGAACMLVNPSPVPTPYGSWWGEGDEKIFVDHEAFPSFYGTGSEDYYNYSWSRPDLFDHPYCGQPLDTGPGNSGYVSNHRWHILDSMPFAQCFAFYMEVWHHMAFPGLCYGAIAYHYGRPGMIDDHCRVQLSELVVPALPPMAPRSVMGAAGGVFHGFLDTEVEVYGGAIGLDRGRAGASRDRLMTWRAEKGDMLLVSFPVDADGDYNLYLVAAHTPEGGKVRLLLDKTPLIVERLGGADLGRTNGEELTLKSRYASRFLNTTFRKIPLTKGKHALTIKCAESGRFGFDYFWVRKN